MKKTVSIGIPAYNEEANIGSLLDSLLMQKQDTYELEKIIVVSDGSSDKTEKLVSDFSRKNELVTLIADGKREGKAVRLNQIHSLCQSDFLITMDGDVVFPTSFELDKILKKFRSRDILLVAGYKRPINPKGFFEKIVYAHQLLWYEVRKNFKEGNNVFNSSGSFMVMRKEFAKSFTYPKGLVSDPQFIYHQANLKKGFRFTSSSAVLFRLPTNFSDYFRQVSRFTEERQPILDYFGEKIFKEYNIPLKYKIKAILTALKNDLFFTFLSLLLLYIVRILPKRCDDLSIEGQWQPIVSTKSVCLRKESKKKDGLKIKDFLAFVFASLEKLLGIDPPKATILCYHSISNDGTIVDVRPEEFLKQLTFLKEGFKFITLDEVLLYVQGKKVIRQPSVALTFDDGYQDVLKNVVPVLKKYKIPATIFVLADPYGANRKELGNNKKLLNFSEIKKLQKAGWTIGCHTATHADLSMLEKAELKKEIVDSKAILEKKLGKPINFFSYPKGIYNKRIILEARKANYKAAFTTGAGIIKKWNDFYKIPRVGIDGSISPYQFPVFLTSSSVFYFSVKNKVGKLKNLIRIKYEKNHQHYQSGFWRNKILGDSSIHEKSCIGENI